MADVWLIDAKALKEKLQADHDFYVNAWGGFKNLPANDKARVDEITASIAAVVNAPTIDAVPVVHARWVHEQRYRDSGGWVWRCSACRREAISPIISALKYCHSCGAKMDAKEC